MGSFDDALKNAVPGGNLATPIAVAVGALILGKLFGGGSSPAPAPAAPAPAPRPGVAPDQSARHQHHRRFERPDRPVDGGRRGPAGQFLGWPRTERSIQPGQLGGALGGGVLDEISKRTGLSQQELLNQLATVLPQVDQQPDPEGAGADGRRSREEG